MALLRTILFPFALVYGLITTLRNRLYDWGIFRSYAFEVPVIVVGNLSVGGTGKTPMVEYLVRLLSANNKVAILSRGYRRKSKGFVLADAASTVTDLGDEPFQYHTKFPEVTVAVDADRVNGIRRLLGLGAKPDVIVLDDAYQHRRVKPGFSILLTTYNEPYCNDYLLPTGNLREGRSGARRADIVVVTKCPPGLDDAARAELRKRLQLEPRQSLFFTSIAYDTEVRSAAGSLLTENVRRMPKLLVAGIAKPEPFFAFLRSEADTTLVFPDHHDFSAADIASIREKAAGRPIVTTEKDYVRLKDKLDAGPLYYLPMQSVFLEDGDQFDELVRDFVR